MPNIHHIRRSLLYAPAVVVAGGGNEAETDAFLARTSGLDGTHIAAYEALINGLVQDGVFALLDILKIYATEDTTTALLNLVQDAFNGTEVGSPGFTVDEGYSCTVSAYITNGFNPSTAGGNLTQNSATLMAYVRNSRTDFSGSISLGGNDGTNYLDLAPRYNFSSGGMWGRLNETIGGEIFTNANAQGQNIFTRTAVSTTEFYKNGASVAAGTATSSALPNIAIFEGVSNNNGSPTDGSDQLAAIAVGAGLDDTQAAALDNRVNAYMTAIGKEVY